MPAIVQAKSKLTADEFARSAQYEKDVELIGGEVIEMTPSGWRHGEIAYKVTKLFDVFCQEHSELDFAGENVGFLLTRGPDTVLSPDAALFRRRPKPEKSPWLDFAPEIVVEVLSPSNTMTEMVYKRHIYFDRGTEQFWLVDPGARTVEFYHRDGRVVTVTGDEVINGEGIAAGMRISLPEIFRER